MYSRPISPKAIDAVLEDIFKLYVTALPQCWPIALVAAVIVLVPTLNLTLQIESVEGDPRQMLGFVTSPGYWGNLLLMTVVSLTLNFAMLIRVANVANDEEGSINSAIARALSLLPRILGATLLFVLACLVGMVLLIVPGIIWFVSFLLAGAFIVIEDAGAVESLSRSRRLVKGNWWRTLAIWTIAVIVVYLLQLASGLVGGLVSADPTNVFIVSYIIHSVFLSPLSSAAILGIYFDLKLRKEGDDIADRVASLERA